MASQLVKTCMGDLSSRQKVRKNPRNNKSYITYVISLYAFTTFYRFYKNDEKLDSTDYMIWIMMFFGWLNE